MTGILSIFLGFVWYNSYISNHKELLFSNNYDLVSSKKIEIPDGASIRLTSSYTGHTSTEDKEFVLTKNTKKKKLEEFLGGTQKNIYLSVKDGTSVIYSYNFGVCDEGSSEKILKAYNILTDNKSIESNTYRYKIFKIFYYDKEVIEDVSE